MKKRQTPGPGQESVWDYPRPPKIESFNGHIRIVHQGTIIYDHNRAFRILETSHPPTYYLPLEHFIKGVIQENPASSYCEFKGRASYFDVISNGKRTTKAAWGYANPNVAYADIKGHISIYASKMERCLVNDEEVLSQQGDFYGGWITSNIVGPFKGAPGTWGW